MLCGASRQWCLSPTLHPSCYYTHTCTGPFKAACTFVGACDILGCIPYQDSGSCPLLSPATFTAFPSSVGSEARDCYTHPAPRPCSTGAPEVTGVPLQTRSAMRQKVPVTNSGRGHAPVHKTVPATLLT